MRPAGIVIGPPIGEQLASVIERQEQRLVRQLVAKSPVETLNEGVVRKRGAEALKIVCAESWEHR